MKKNFLLIASLTVAAFLLTICFVLMKKDSLIGIFIELPEDLHWQETGKASQIFYRGDVPVGGVIQFSVPDMMWQAKPMEHLEEICEALKKQDAPLPEKKYDYLTSASPGDSLHMWLRDPETGREWEHFVQFYPDALLPESTAYDFWFDKTEIDEAEIMEILESARFDPQ